ncbi:hypothetical protein LCGC14_2757600 [marine sediment metagenome]|uniref:Uncharacterized protein n=1 Tax=marine sediment metagenome TaxID=412755 RepID=A0A0F9B8I4_9ZZZZ
MHLSSNHTGSPVVPAGDRAGWPPERQLGTSIYTGGRGDGSVQAVLPPLFDDHQKRLDGQLAFYQIGDPAGSRHNEGSELLLLADQWPAGIRPQLPPPLPEAPQTPLEDSLDGR